MIYFSLNNCATIFIAVSLTLLVLAAQIYLVESCGGGGGGCGGGGFKGGCGGYKEKCYKKEKSCCPKEEKCYKKEKKDCCECEKEKYHKKEKKEKKKKCYKSVESPAVYQSAPPIRYVEVPAVQRSQPVARYDDYDDDELQRVRRRWRRPAPTYLPDDYYSPPPVQQVRREQVRHPSRLVRFIDAMRAI